MARAKSGGNGRIDRLEEAMAEARRQEALLLQHQTALTQQQTALFARMAETDRVNAERFARIETILMDHSRILMEHSRILAEHGRILAALPDAIRDKIGFKGPTPRPAE